MFLGEKGRKKLKDALRLRVYKSYLSKNPQVTINQIEIFVDSIMEDMLFSKENGIKKSLGDLQSLDLIPSTFYLNELEQEITSASSTQGLSPFNIMKLGLNRHQILEDYNYILIDCPPNLNLITLNAIFASDYFIIPTIPDMLSTLGLPLLIRKLQTVKKRRYELDSQMPKLLGIILTKISYQLRGIQTSWIEEQIPWMLGRYIEDNLVSEDAKLFENKIKEAADIQKAVEDSKPLCTSKQKSTEIRIQFQHLAREIIQNMK